MATKQIRLPQQWIPLGYETYGWNGEWRDAAKLIKVDKSPVTREWTADPNTGTSNRNEAIWVMTVRPGGIQHRLDLHGPDRHA